MTQATIVERRLPGSGLMVKLQMPDLYSMLSAGAMPNDLIAPVVLLLEGVKPRETDLYATLTSARDNMRALYHIAHLCLVEPRLVLTGERKEGEIGPRDLRWDDLTEIYLNFFRGEPLGAFAAFTGADQPQEPVGVAQSGDAVSHEAEPDPSGE